MEFQVQVDNEKCKVYKMLVISLHHKTPLTPPMRCSPENVNIKFSNWISERKLSSILYYLSSFGGSSDREDLASR